MIFLRKYRFDVALLIRHIHAFYAAFMSLERVQIPFHRLFTQRIRIRYPRLLLGLFFLILLLTILFALPASANNQSPYLSVNDFPSRSPTLLAVEPQPVSVDPAIPLPVTGR